MRITSFQFKDKTFEWSLDGIELDRLTLLVGASGVGKTQILKAIQALKRVVNGKSINGIKWSINFETITGMAYVWKGEFDNKVHLPFRFEEETDEDNKKNLPNIISENLKLNGEEIIKRTSKETFFEGIKTLKLSPQQSTMFILKEEDLIRPVYEGFNKIIYSDYSESQTGSLSRLVLYNNEKLLRKYDTLQKIQESDEDIIIKLHLISVADKRTFSKIVERFCEIFPQVEDVKIAPIDVEDEGLPSFFKDSPFIQIKEKGVDNWIKQSKISSGMFRTLIHISEIYLCPEGTIFLIDEFENSLGINCIDELTNDILTTSRQIQFIITSHHPYIINNIHFSFWKLVTRKHGHVKAHPVTKFNIGKSKHDAFMQLMQLEEYQTGLE